MKKYRKVGYWLNDPHGFELIEKNGRIFALCGYSSSNDYFRRCWEVSDQFTAKNPEQLFIAEIKRAKNDFTSKIVDYVIYDR